MSHPKSTFPICFIVLDENDLLINCPFKSRLAPIDCKYSHIIFKCSPDGAFFVWIHERLSAALEGGTELRGVPQRAEHPEAAGRVGVGRHLVRLVLRAVVAAPHLGVAQEEQLLGGQAQASHWPRLARVRVIPEEGCEGCLQPAVVCNVLS